MIYLPFFVSCCAIIIAKRKIGFVNKHRSQSSNNIEVMLQIEYLIPLNTNRSKSEDGKFEKILDIEQKGALTHKW